MSLNWEKIYERRATGSYKWDQVLSFDPPLPHDTLSMSVADMDWPAPEVVSDHVADFVRTHIPGYTAIPDSYYEAVSDWLASHWKVKVERDWIIPTNGVVPDLNHGVQLLTDPGDQVLIFTPVYPPFHTAATKHDRILRKISLKDDGNHFSIDWEALEAAASEPRSKLLILCNPHNPVGRVWTVDELQRLTQIVTKHKLYVLSDEIHADLLAPGVEHTSIASISESMKKRTITMTAPSKTFNLAAYKLSNLVIPDETLRERWRSFRAQQSLVEPSILSVVACEAAYRHGRPWLEELRGVIDANERIFREAFARALPSVRIAKREGTYLLWLDMRSIEPDPDRLFNLLGREARVLGNSGLTFGEEGRGWVRFNLATSPQRVEEAVRRLILALTTYNVQL